jgi:hypothetical protein
MRKIIVTTLMAASIAFAEPSIDHADVAPADIAPAFVNAALPSAFSFNPSLPETEVSKQGFFYVRFAAAESDFIHASPVVPGLGIGYRRLAGNGAADISISGLGTAERKSGNVYWAVPKASYFRYLNPEAKGSLYLGGGIAWGGIESKNQKFIGLVPSATAGYEFARKSTVLGFSELNISQPTLSVYRKGTFPGPIAEAIVGIGF